MDPRKFLEFALILKTGQGSPESYRTSIGRSYYAAFNVGVATLTSIGVSCSQKPSGHGEVVNCLSGSGNRDCDKAGARLRALHGRRIEADYNLEKTAIETYQEADLAHKEATAIVGVLDELKNQPGMEQARIAIKRHASAVLRLPVS